ncbi:MAG: glycosyl hydrolase [Nitrospinales bacterium]
MNGEVERSLEKAFDNPPESAKASGYWWWLNNNVNKEAITRDLENFRAKGMGSVLLVCTGNRTTGAMLSVPLPNQGGLENDFLDRGGVELMFENTDKLFIEAAGPLAGNTLRAFCSDSFEAGYHHSP